MNNTAIQANNMRMWEPEKKLNLFCNKIGHNYRKLARNRQSLFLKCSIVMQQFITDRAIIRFPFIV